MVLLFFLPFLRNYVTSYWCRYKFTTNRLYGSEIVIGGQMQCYFGGKNFNFVIKNKQLEIIESILQGNDTFAVLPTGYGKTVCYVLPPLFMDKVDTYIYSQ